MRLGARAFDHLLNLVAFVGLRYRSPTQAQRWVAKLGRLGPELGSKAEAMSALEGLGSFGSCLSRSLSVASRCPGAHVVIGVTRPSTDQACRGTQLESAIRAHAWVELDGTPLYPEPENWAEIARVQLRPRPSTSLRASSSDPVA